MICTCEKRPATLLQHCSRHSSGDSAFDVVKSLSFAFLSSSLANTLDVHLLEEAMSSLMPRGDTSLCQTSAQGGLINKKSAADVSEISASSNEEAGDYLYLLCARVKYRILVL